MTPFVRPLDAGGPDQCHQLRRCFAYTLATVGVEVVCERHELAEQLGIEVVGSLFECLAVAANNGELFRLAFSLKVVAQPLGSDAAHARRKIRGPQSRGPAHNVVGEPYLLLVQKTKQGHHVERVAILQARQGSYIEVWYLAEPAQIAKQLEPARAMSQILVKLAITVNVT